MQAQAPLPKRRGLPPNLPLPTMHIFSYPNSTVAIDQLQSFCSASDLPAPWILGEDDVETSLFELVARADSAQGVPSNPADPAIAAARFDLEVPVIIFHRINEEDIRGLISKYKAAGQWPIFVVVTPASIEQKLSFLIPQFIEDREREQAWRKKKRKDEA
jgi:hypothetical protein